MCAINGKVANTLGRRDLAHKWNLVKLSAEIYQAESVRDAKAGQGKDLFEAPWATHPFGRAMIHSLINDSVKNGDIQTAAMLTCVFYKRDNNPKKVAGNQQLHASHQQQQLQPSSPIVNINIINSSQRSTIQQQMSQNSNCNNNMVSTILSALFHII